MWGNVFRQCYVEVGCSVKFKCLSVRASDTLLFVFADPLYKLILIRWIFSPNDLLMFSCVLK